ncbi:MAG: M48 family metalloprotease [Deltaproteobacteria bacterium]|nr:M48 family metalloprotease [Deltaproteobacteria bacterium]
MSPLPASRLRPLRGLAVRGLTACLCLASIVSGPGCTGMSPEREASIGHSAAREVEQQMGLVEDPALVSYVERLGVRIARHSPRQDVTYRFHVVDMQVPNAFALPGGYIYVSRGLLALTNDESELAGVLGHEIGHVASHHAAERETQAAGAGLLSTLVSILAAAFGGGVAGDVVSDMGQMAAAGHVASYGRDQEREADELGQKMAAESGYDPAGMSHFLQRLGRVTELQTGEPEIPTFLDSHPATYERARTTAWRASSLQVSNEAPLSATRAAYLGRLVGLSVGENPAQGVFSGGRFIQPQLGIAIDFPPGWTTVNQADRVGAFTGNSDALVALEFQRGSEDPSVAADSFARAQKLTLRNRARTSVAGSSAYRAQANTSDSRTLDLTWIAAERGTWRVVGQCARSRYGSYSASFEAVARSFRKASARELSSIRVKRLYVVRAKPGESLADLSRRSRSAWSTRQTAVYNGLDESTRFAGGELVKVVVERPLPR